MPLDMDDLSQEERRDYMQTRIERETGQLEADREEMQDLYQNPTEYLKKNNAHLDDADAPDGVVKRLANRVRDVFSREDDEASPRLYTAREIAEDVFPVTDPRSRNDKEWYDPETGEKEELRSDLDVAALVGYRYRKKAEGRDDEETHHEEVQKVEEMDYAEKVENAVFWGAEEIRESLEEADEVVAVEKDGEEYFGLRAWFE